MEVCYHCHSTDIEEFGEIGENLIWCNNCQASISQTAFTFNAQAEDTTTQRTLDIQVKINLGDVIDQTDERLIMENIEQALVDAHEAGTLSPDDEGARIQSIETTLNNLTLADIYAQEAEFVWGNLVEADPDKYADVEMAQYDYDKLGEAMANNESLNETALEMIKEALKAMADAKKG